MKKFRKLLLLICVLTCAFAITSCGKKEEKKISFEYSEEEFVNCITTNTETVAEWSDKEIEATMSQYSETSETEVALSKGLQQFMDARSESGDYVGFYLDDNNAVKYSISKDYDEDTVTVTLRAQFKKRDVIVKYTFGMIEEQVGIVSMIYEPKYSLGETMKKAGMNTLIGISTVVCVLIFLSILISLFAHVSKIETFFKNLKNGKKNEENTSKVNNTNTNTNAQAVEASDFVDDAELVAVIAAAIAAAEQTTTDGFVVRSIKRVSRR